MRLGTLQILLTPDRDAATLVDVTNGLDHAHSQSLWIGRGPKRPADQLVLIMPPPVSPMNFAWSMEAWRVANHEGWTNGKDCPGSVEGQKATHSQKGSKA